MLNDAYNGSIGSLNIYLQINVNKKHPGGLIDEISIFTFVEYIVKCCPNLYLKGLMLDGSTKSSFGSGENQDFRV